jgi:hypothetical protein
MPFTNILDENEFILWKASFLHMLSASLVIIVPENAEISQFFVLHGI